MTGPEHYREAERLCDAVTIRDALSGTRILQPGDHRDVLALAQVHATLALAATQVAAAIMLKGDRHEWRLATDPEYAAFHTPEVTR